MLGDEDAEKRLEDELKAAIEARLGERFAFSLPETARILNRCTKWATQKANSGKLRTVRLDGQRVVLRPVIVSAFLEGI
jgi:hypothetical protein